MSPGILALLSFLAALFAVVGVYSIISDLFLRDRARVSQRVDDTFRQQQRERIRKSSLFKGLDQAALKVPADAAPNLQQRFVAVVDQSGLNLTPDRLLYLMLAAGLGVGAITFLLRRSVWLAAAACVVAGAVPFLFVLYKRNARLEKLLGQLPDAFDLMSRVIRAGQTMSQAMLAVADEFDQPVAGEFSYCYEQQNLGLPTELALRDLARRTGLLDVKIFVLGIVVQQQTGGNLAELLDKLSHVIRERFRIRGKIRALTAEGRFQAVVLLVMPVALMLAMMVLSKDYARALSEAPNLIVGMFFLEGIGALWIRQIVNFDF